MFETGESALILFTSFLPTSLQFVFGVSLCGGGNFMGVLRVGATMFHFLQTVRFFPRLLYNCHSLGAFAMSRRATTIVCPPVRIEQLSFHLKIFMKFDILSFFKYMLRKFIFNINLRRIMGTDMKT